MEGLGQDEHARVYTTLRIRLAPGPLSNRPVGTVCFQNSVSHKLRLNPFFILYLISHFQIHLNLDINIDNNVGKPINIRHETRLTNGKKAICRKKNLPADVTMYKNISRKSQKIQKNRIILIFLLCDFKGMGKIY